MTYKEFLNLSIEDLINNYRVKTKEEFEFEFGPEWRLAGINGREACAFPRDKDIILGKPLNDSIFKYVRFIHGAATGLKRLEVLAIDRAYIMSHDMLTLQDNPILHYNKKQTDKDVSKCMFKIEL